MPNGATEWRKYDKDVKLSDSKTLSNKSLEWKIYQDIVLYKGNMLPPQKITEEPYWGEIVKVETFSGDIDDEWLVSQIRELYEQ